jgi:stearoyl-CoA desaturase (delta-9 desaturase)
MSFPELRWLDRFDIMIPVALAVLVFFVGMLLEYTSPELGTDRWQMLVWGFFVSTVACYHGTYSINSLSHVFGRQRYHTGDSSRNNWLLALITLGEGWHNNHHHYPSAARQGFYWWEVDITYYGLKLLSWLGIIWDLKPIPIAARDHSPRRIRPRT